MCIMQTKMYVVGCHYMYFVLIHIKAFSFRTRIGVHALVQSLRSSIS